MLKERPEVDAVMIMNAKYVLSSMGYSWLRITKRVRLTSSEYHVPHTVQCLQAGKHVFLEKPMCWTLEGAEEIIQQEKASGKTVFVGYMRRYAEAFLTMKERIQEIPTEKISYGKLLTQLSLANPSADPRSSSSRHHWISECYTAGHLSS